MDDLISRQAAKDYIDTQEGRPFIGCTVGEAMKIMLDEVPSAEWTGHWIPCKERHPKERGKYLVSFTEGNQLHVSICDWQVTTRHWNLTGCRSYWHPVAWMPLPEPYREGGEQE